MEAAWRISSSRDTAILVPDVEPLASERRHLATERRMRRNEGGVRQHLGEVRRKPDQVVAVRAVSVQQNDQRVGFSPRCRSGFGPGKLDQIGHSVSGPLSRPGGVGPARPPDHAKPGYFLQGRDLCSSSSTHFLSFIVRT